MYGCIPLYCHFSSLYLKAPSFFATPPFYYIYGLPACYLHVAVPVYLACVCQLVTEASPATINYSPRLN